MTFEEFKKQNYEPERIREIEYVELKEFVRWYCERSRDSIIITKILLRNDICNLNSLKESNIDKFEACDMLTKTRKLIIQEMKKNS